jgi:hypothetical protein
MSKDDNKKGPKMNDPSPPFWDMALDAAKVLFAAIVGWITWAFRKISIRLHALEKDTIDRDEFNQTIDALRTDIKDSARETHRRLDKLYMHISETRRE